MSNRGPVVLMLLDSLADAYVKRGDAPFYTSKLVEGQYTDIDSLFAFEGVMAAALCGRWPDETGVFARFAYGPEQSVMRKNPLRVLNLIDRHAYYADGERRDGRQNFVGVKAVRKALRKWWITGGFNNLGPYGRVPMALAHNFRYCMILGTFDKTMELAGYETLFGRAERFGKKGVSFYGELPRAKEFLSSLPSMSSLGVILIHTWSKLDMGGHEHGPDSEDIRRIVRSCDDDLSNFLPWLERQLPEASFVLFADHGMEPVHTTIDVSPVVTDAIDGKGPLVFVDSTAVRAWGAPDELDDLAKRLKKYEGTQVLGEAELKLRHAWFPDNDYGQLIVAVAPGYIFVPDYFESWKPRKGMHGYYQDTPWVRPSLFWYGPAFRDKRIDFQPQDMTDVWRLADHALTYNLEGT